MTLSKAVISWTGIVGQPGYTIFYASGNANVQAQLAPFFDAMKLYFPASVRIAIPNTGDIIEEADGRKTGTWGSGSTSVISGTGIGTYSPASGALIKWGTSAFQRGRRVVGRTFLVPLTTSAYDANGQVAATATAAIQAAATSFITTSGGVLSVWHRPLMDYSVKPPVQKLPGAAVPIITATVPVKVAVLRSRRDTS